MSDKKHFICPHCKKISGFNEYTPTRGWQSIYYDEFGKNIGGENEVSHYYKSRAAQRYLGIDEEEKC